MRALVFNTLLQRLTAAVFTVMLLILAACGEDEPAADPVTISFPAGPLEIGEAAGEKVINIALSSAATKDGVITISASTGSAALVTFETEVTVTKGNTVAQFRFTPVNNATIDGAKSVTFTLSEVTSGFEIGTPASYVVNIVDDEGPTTAFFTTATGTVSENASAALSVSITLSPAAKVAGTIEVTMTPADAAVTTIPAAVAGKVSVPVAVGQTTVSFTVLPTNNDDDNEDVEVDFEITSGTTGINVGTNVDYTLTITDDDNIVPTTIADIRALYSTSDVTISEDLYIEGVVISNNSNVTNRNIFIQDATGSIVVRFTATHAYAQGDKLLINLNGVLLTRDAGSGNTGPLQLGGTAGLDATIKVTNTGTGTVPAAETITVAQLNAGTYEGKLVKVENVFFPDADGLIKLNGSRTLSNGTITTLVRSESYSPWQNNAIPLGSGTVEGIASIFNTAAQLIPLEAADIFTSNPVGTIGITGTLVDFGSVNINASSAEQSYTVQGTTLTSDIVVTASAGYQVSLTSGGTFGSTVTIPAASANAATTVFVKFSPTTGANQVVNGTLTHKSQGAVSVVTNVTGTEIGNVGGTGTLIIYELYGGGGNTGATFTNDYIVLYNGTANAIDLSGYSIHYASATGNFGATNNSNLSGTINAGDYFLIQLAAGTTVLDKPLPVTPDLAPSLHGNVAQFMNLGGAAGKFALATGAASVALTGKADARVVDYIGFGTTASDFETTAAPAPSNSTSIKRKTFVDSNNNGADFEVVNPPTLNYL